MAGRAAAAGTLGAITAVLTANAANFIIKVNATKPRSTIKMRNGDPDAVPITLLDLAFSLSDSVHDWLNGYRNKPGGKEINRYLLNEILLACMIVNPVNTAKYTEIAELRSNFDPTVDAQQHAMLKAIGESLTDF
jgi:hypothetical protein